MMRRCSYGRRRCWFEMNNVVGRTWQGPDFASHKARWEQARQAEAEHQDQLERDRVAAIAAANAKRDSEVASAALRLKTDAASQNSVLSDALQVLHGASTYNHWEYTLAVLVASLLLSLTLEGTMWTVFTALAITYGDAFTASLQVGELADQYAAASRTEDRLDAEDARAFRAHVLREKKSILQIIRGWMGRQ